MAADLNRDFPGADPTGSEDEFDPEAEDGDLNTLTRRAKDYEKLFERARGAIKAKKKFAREADVDDFFSEYEDIVGKTLSKVSGNLLHTLVEVVKHNDEIRSEDVELLVRRLVQKFPDLLIYTDKQGYNPLYLAIIYSNHQMVDYMISTCIRNQNRGTAGPDPMKCVDDALCTRVRAGESRTCLHAALKENFQSATTRSLIQIASYDALRVQDELGKTPMHYTVQKCSRERAELIDLFIERDLRAMQSQNRPETTFLDLADLSGCSVYQEHQKIRSAVSKRFKDHMAKKAREGANNASDRTGTSRVDGKTAPRDSKEATRAQASARDARQAAASKYEGERGTDNAGRGGGADENIDDRERLRQQRKAEEAARLKKEEKEAVERESRGDRAKDRETTGRDTKEPDDIRSNDTTRQLDPAPNTPVKRTNTARLDGKQARDKQPAKPAQSTRRGHAGDKGTMVIWNKFSEEILLKLKLHYMRTRNAERVISFIYGTNMDDIQISFEYDDLPRKMPWNDFVTHFGKDTESGLKFDEVLQNVTFPYVEVGLTGVLAGKEQDEERQTGVRRLGALGRKDMKYLFQWLHKKGVRHIIKVSVHDSGDSGEKVHSDEAIQESLRGFVVEHLDWQKTDLDPETILQVSSQVEIPTPMPEDPKHVELVPDRQLKELSLRWSGSNAVLRAWSEPEGLPLLPQLQKIHLFKPPLDKTYDNPQWINQKVNEFRIRLNKNVKEGRAPRLGPVEQGSEVNATAMREIEVIPKDARIDEDRQVLSRETPNFNTISAPVKGVNSHRWLDATSRFASEMLPFWQNTLKEFLESRKNQGTLERTEDDVVVVLIDDGVDQFDTALSNQVLAGKSFDFHDEKVRPPYSSARGHGTVMANMILRVCPMAKIYPIRLKTFPTPGGKSQIDERYAAQAIQAALDRKATIISMSWTLPMKKGKSKTKDYLHSVLQKAVDSRVLMFCSSPDDGKFTELDYPSGPWRDARRFFRIGAARADGTVFEWTPEDGITFVLPGVEVIKEQVGSSSMTSSSSSSTSPGSRGGVTSRVVNFKYETGSSVATALAAGLAAMIIYCVKASILAVKTANQSKGPIVGIGIPDNGAITVAQHDAMLHAFRSLGKVTPNGFIQVWDELDKISEVLENARVPNLSQEAKLKRTNKFVEFGLKLTERGQSDVA